MSTELAERRTLIAAGCVLMLSAVAWAGPRYTFTKIAATGADDISAFDNFVSINNLGTVAFEAVTSSGPSAICTGNGASVSKLYYSGSAQFSWFNMPDINDIGQVALYGVSAAGAAGIWRSDGSSLTQISTDPTFVPDDLQVSINNAGQVAFKGGWTSGGVGVAVGSGGALTYIARQSDNFSYAVDPVINSVGSAAFIAMERSTGVNHLVTGNGGLLTQITTSASYNLQGDVQYNASGRVLFDVGDANVFSGPTSISTIFSAHDGVIEKYIDNSGPFAGFFNDYGATFCLNDNNQVMFFANLDSGAQGLFDGFDPNANRIIQSGDSVFGKRVSSVVLGENGLNDQGQLAFLVLCTDGSQLLLRADPVPEPSCVLLIALGALAAVRRRKPAPAHDSR